MKKLFIAALLVLCTGGLAMAQATPAPHTGTSKRGAVHKKHHHHKHHRHHMAKKHM